MKRYGKWIILYSLLLYVAICCVLFFFYVRPALRTGDDLHVGADSYTYMTAAEAIDFSGGVVPSLAMTVSFQGQLLGPVLIAKTMGTTSNIAVFNLFIFLLGLWYASRLPGVNIGVFFPLLLLNVTTTASILTLNKEILAYIAIILLVRYIYSARRSMLGLAVVLLISLAARWEQALIVMLFLTVEHRWSFLKGRHKTVLALMIAGITILWPLMLSTGVVDLASLLGTAADAQSATLPLLNKIQAAYGFPIVLIPKIVGEMFGFTWLTLLKTITGHSVTDVQNQVISPFQNMAMQLVFLGAFLKRKLDFRKPTIFWIGLYVVMSAAAPIFQPRYEYPVYILLCLEISGLTCAEVSEFTQRSILGDVLKIPKYIPAS